MQQIKELEKKWRKAVSKNDFSLAANIQNQITALRNRRVNQPVKDIMKEMPAEDVKEASKLCRKIPVYADLLQTVAVELQSVLRKTDPSINILLMEHIDSIRKNSNSIVSIITDLNDSEFSESFCQLSDRISLIVDNVFNEQEARLKNNNTINIYETDSRRSGTDICLER